MTAAGPTRALAALLNTHSFFTQGAGVSSPRALARAAANAGFEAIALTDDLCVGGAVELHAAAREGGVTPLVGATVPLESEGETYPLVLLAASRAGYRTLNEIVTVALEARTRSVTLAVLEAHPGDLFCLTGGRDGFPTRLLAARRVTPAVRLLASLRGVYRDRLFVQLYHDLHPSDARRARGLRAMAREHGLPVVAAPDVRYASADLYPLLDAVACARLGITVNEPHRDRPRNDAQAIGTPEAHGARLPFPDALANARAIAREAHFELLPERLTPARARIPGGVTPDEHLERRCFEALVARYGGRADMPRARARLEEELAVIRSLSLADFFLMAAEVTDFCRARGIVAAGRGSAAASVVCFLLGITLSDPVRHDLLFERFLHTGRTSLPDVDIDIASARRDEVLAWAEERFGRDCEAMVANRITYRLPLAVQDLGRAFGLPPEDRNRLSKGFGRDYRHLRPRRAREALEVFTEVLGDAPAKDALLGVLERMEAKHFRHFAPHSGGVIASREPLAHYSPLDRSTGGIRLLQFDKDDAEALGLIKLDLLGLRMLSVLERARESIHRLEGVWVDFVEVPDDPAVWRRIGAGDTMGLFQVESPAQVRISTDLKPENFTDLAHQIALIRPGPIQSGTVHPYVRRRKGLEPVRYPHPALEPILGKSYGVLLFQEDVLRIAVHWAGFSWPEADGFRKRVSSFDELADIEPDRERFTSGAMRTSGATREEALEVWGMIAAFQGYGFAESHAWAFAQHAYASAYLRSNWPAEYFAAVLTEHPGMWSRSTIRQEIRRWGIPMLSVDVNRSGSAYACVRTGQGKAIRPPLSSIDGITADTAKRIVLERLVGGPFSGVDALHARVRLARDELQALARGGAFDALAGRREALYRVNAVANALVDAGSAGVTPLFSGVPEVPPVAPLSADGAFAWDYELKGFSERDAHPIDRVRPALRDAGAVALVELRRRRGRVVTAGLVVSRQKPPTAKGFAFYVLEDGPVRAQLIIGPDVWERERELLRDARVLLVEGTVEAQGHQPAVKAVRLWAVPLW